TDPMLNEYLFRPSSPQPREFPGAIAPSPMPLPPSLVNGSWAPDRGKFLLRPASLKRHPTILHSSIRTSRFLSPLTATSITASRYFTPFASRLSIQAKAKPFSTSAQEPAITLPYSPNLWARRDRFLPTKLNRISRSAPP